MLLTNHVLTGVLLGLTIDNPVILAPTAVASHLLMDATPHFGHDAMKKGAPFRSPAFIALGSIDFAVSIAVTIGACLLWPHKAVNIVIGAVGAALPDLTYIPIIIFGQKLVYKIPGYRPMITLLARIQWYEKPPGLITEIIWTTLMLALLSKQLQY